MTQRWFGVEWRAATQTNCLRSNSGFARLSWYCPHVDTIQPTLKVFPLPEKAPPTSIQLVLKTHTLAIFLHTQLSATLPSIKADALSALQQFSAIENEEKGVPIVSSEDDFELFRREETTTGTGRNATSTERFVTLDGSKTVKQQGLVNWNVIYVRFRDEGGGFLCLASFVYHLSLP